MKKILFVCTGNTCRSSMAEAILKDILEKNEKNLDINVKSAGIFAVEGSRASRNAIEVLKSENIDLSSHKATLLSEELIDEADLILTMTNYHKNLVLRISEKAADKVYLLNEYAFDEIRDINDPYGGDLNVYKESANEIRNALNKVLEKILKEDKNENSNR